MDVSKNRGGKPPKMDGENNGKPYEQMDDLGGNTPIFGNTHIKKVYKSLLSDFKYLLRVKGLALYAHKK